MLLSSSYRLISSALMVAITIGTLLPSGIHFSLPEECEEMKMMHAGNEDENEHEECTMEQAALPPSNSDHDKHSSLNYLGFDCACNLDQAPLKTEAPALHKVKVPVLNLSFVIE